MLNKKFWNEVWVQITAAVTVSVLVALFGYLRGWWPTVLGVLKQMHEFLVRLHAGLELAFDFVGTLYAHFLGDRYARNYHRKPSEPWRQYTEDTFDGLKWHWDYGDDGKPWNLRS